MIYDYCVVGGGIIGLATARALLARQPGASLVLLEKESEVAAHQSGHNSGVIHAGIYYEPGSLKAKLCRAGHAATVAFCKEHQLPYEVCGKLIVATNAVEKERLDALYSRATANGLKLERLDASELRRCEPNVAGIAALLSAETGMVDYVAVCRKLADLVSSTGAMVRFNTPVDHMREHSGHVEIGAADESWSARRLVVCGGLQSDRLARIAGLPVDFRIVPFRGEYFRLPKAKNNVVRHHIYPAPDPGLPFLGIHLTRMIDGSVTVGPNAVLGFSREGYQKLAVDMGDVLDFATFPGFWKLTAAHMRHALHELRGSLSLRAYLDECRKYCPTLASEDLLPFRAGIRAQVVSREGRAVHDFLLKQTDRMLHVCNAPSPAATSALPLGTMIANRLLGESEHSASVTI